MMKPVKSQGPKLPVAKQSKRRPGVKVVVACGACKGEDINKQLHYYPNAHIYAIEPVPSNYKHITELYHKNSKVTLITKAAWIENGKRTMNIYHSPVSHSLLIKPKLEQHPKGVSKLEVETFDLAEFLAQFEKNSVILRMDIEGAEYAVLEHCFEKEVMDRIMELQIEFHAGWRVPSISMAKHTALKERLYKTVAVREVS